MVGRLRLASVCRPFCSLARPAGEGQGEGLPGYGTIVLFLSRFFATRLAYVIFLIFDTL